METESLGRDQEPLCRSSSAVLSSFLRGAGGSHSLFPLVMSGSCQLDYTSLQNGLNFKVLISMKCDIST